MQAAELLSKPLSRGPGCHSAGREVRENMFEEIARLYHDLDQGMQPISVIFPNLPIAVHRTRDRSGTYLLMHGSLGLVWDCCCMVLTTRLVQGGMTCTCAGCALLINSAVLEQAAACRARKQVAAIFKKVIEKRRATGTKEDDVLQVRVHLCLTPHCACRRSKTVAAGARQPSNPGQAVPQVTGRCIETGPRSWGWQPPLLPAYSPIESGGILCCLLRCRGVSSLTGHLAAPAGVHRRKVQDCIWRAPPE